MGTAVGNNCVCCCLSWGDGNHGTYANLHAVACHRAHRTSDLREDYHGGQPEER